MKGNDLKTLTKFFVLSFALAVVPNVVFAGQKESTSLLSDTTFAGLKLRNVGPALMAGRIADIAIHPDDNNLWYVAVGSGGVWKTKNAGVTWTPIFDDQSSYSIGCVTIDPNNPHVIWVGTGENVGGRHVGYGDGIYRSQDGGTSWENLGLKESHHISKIIIHPKYSNIIWAAAQGPLWSKGGERGLYKSVDNGKTWKKVLGDDEWVGATDTVIDPRNPDWLYAATWQRHRNVAAYMGGGPGSGIHRSTDGGDTWEKLGKGLPKSNMGKIGLAISAQRPDVLYAAIELDRRTGAVYRSSDRGGSWTKQSEAISGGTGPHYYQEIYASPHQYDRIYLMDVRMQVSEDGGKNFRRMKEEHKHVDNHALAFRSDDPDYLLVGTDGGIYESFDLAENWRFIANLPVTQFYKVALDDTEPFYNIYGGTQDNNTQGGPSRTDNLHGIRNSDWCITLFGDGHQPATEPGNPDIMYSEMQQGFLVRVDRTTGEIVYIQPQPEAGEEFERFNWDAPILVSPHSPTRLYFASQRVWRSDDRGDSWTAISGDLTRDQERITLPIMDKTWSWDSPWDLAAMSNYNTITSLAESPLQEGLIFAGTDDGLIQITQDDGKNWRQVEVGSLSGVPKTAFVNDIKADLHDANTVYIALDNHKFGDLNPYLLKSTDRGKSWRSIKGNIPERTLIWRVVQDHIKPDLLFAGTEFGIYFTIDGGGRWMKLSGDVPTISFRDLAIQRRENDLVGATFGRGFYVFDDYSILRHVSEQQLKREATLFPIRKALWYIERPVLGFSEKASQGAAFYTAPNPPFGAVFTYYLAEELKTKKAVRQEKEKELIKQKKDVPFLGWEEMESERRQAEPMIWLTVKDGDGNVVRRIAGPTKKGFHRVAWDLHFPATNAIDYRGDLDAGNQVGVLAAPGEYTVTLSKQIDGTVTDLSKPLPFEVERMRRGALDGAEDKDVAAFWQQIAKLQRATTAASLVLENALKKVDAMRAALSRTPAAPGGLDGQLHELRQTLLEFDEQLNGNRSKRKVGEKINPTINSRLRFAMGGTRHSTYGPTPTLKNSLEIAYVQFDELKATLENILNEQLPEMEEALRKAGAPWVEGQPIPEF
ncbi:MAG: glycosyl hydrolase [Candidatus Latescibacteria bacterium]|nr:glycosyl hydrolase [Candidatus Latescibacterota bacterium]NIO27152.1 glycosyl hydrolase [Candidatus Latescibacterota bacterium]NIO54676.1 glycosyl hydrolase [Candidatus Latescibacterota bacterium]NIT00759.1 glycosyl hydrolase [Candidatus Latescibacterota bacterium]NIT37682.1 glycosyl hydrolase [Candidatus Latescibacterota bacterium]